MHILVPGNKKDTIGYGGGNLNIYSVFSNYKFLTFLLFYIKAKEILKSFKKGDVVMTAQDPFYYGLIAALISIGGQYPFEIQVHTDILGATKNAWLRKKIAYFVLSRANTIRTVSDVAKKSLVTFMPQIQQKIEVLPIAVVTPGFMARAEYSITPTLLVVSRLEPEKNVLESLKIFKDILIRIPHAKLLIAGEGSDRSSIIHYVKDNSLESNVELLGYVKDVYGLYAKSQVLLHTSLFEGFGMVFIEAGMCALPIVSTRVGVAPDITGLSFDIDNRQMITDSIVDILSDENLWKKESLHCQLNAQKFIISQDEYNKKITNQWEKTLSTIQ